MGRGGSILVQNDSLKHIRPGLHGNAPCMWTDTVVCATVFVYILNP